MNPTADVLVVGPRRISVERIVMDYRELNRLVGGPEGPGSISSCPLPPELRAVGFYAYCDDDAISRGQALNRWRTHLGQDQLRGPIVIFRADESGDEHGLSVDDVRRLVKYLADAPSDQARELADRSAAWWRANPSGMEIVSIGSLDALLEDD